MYDNEKTIWFSQTLLTFKDKQFATDGYLKVAISTNTEDYKYFNPPLFNISVSTNIQKSYNLNIQQAEDLLESFNQVLKQANGNEITIEKKYQKNANIYFRFAIENTNQLRVVVIEIISNEADSSRIIIPLKPTFQSILRRLRSFVENYDQLCFSLLDKTINHSSIQVIERLPTLIKGVSSQIVSQIPMEDIIPDSSASEVSSEEVKKTDMTISDLDNFLGEDMSNIDIPELKEEKIKEEPTVVEVKSDFIEKVLDNNLMNIENKLIGFAVSKQPVLDFMTDLESVLKFPLLDSINEDDKKSIVYLSAFKQSYHNKSYTINDVAIPSSTGILKFKGVQNEKNVEFAKDVLLIIGYMRAIRRRLESKIKNAYDNKSIIYLYLRCCMDPCCFSFLDHLDENDIISSIQNRYIYFDKIGLFDSYKRLLEDNNCKPITKKEIIDFAEESSYNIIGKSLFVDATHKDFYESGEVKLPSKNKFSLEQITNEFIPAEVNNKLGFDFKNKEVLENYKENNEISDEVLSFFTKEQKIEKSKMERVVPLQKWVEKYKQDIPEKHRDSFINHVREMKYGKFNFQESSFPLDEFDENIVKALYIWDIDSDSSMKTNFTHFATLVKNEQMTKESILITTAENKNDNSGSDWNNINIGE